MALPDSVDGDAVSTPAGQDSDSDDSWNDLDEDLQSYHDNTNIDEDYEDDHGLYLNAHGAGALNTQDMSSTSLYPPVVDTNLSGDPRATMIPATQSPKPHCTVRKMVTLKLGARRKSTANPPNTSVSQPGGRLLKLPAEIRLLIYAHMFPTDKSDIYAIKGTLHKAEDAHTVAGDHVAILATCRTIYKKAEPVLCANTEFCIHAQDRYWLHLWPSETYVEKFGVEDENVKPRSRLWIELNPWLKNPRSIVHINNARVLSLDIEATTAARARRWTWDSQLTHTLRGARHLDKLQITLDCEPEFGFDQDETNKTLLIIEHNVKCRRAVTGKMGLSLGAEGFASASYHQMLAGLKGVDKTHEVYSNKSASVRSEHAAMLRLLRDQTAVLKSTTKELINLAEERSTWIGYDGVSQEAIQLDLTMKLALSVMSVRRNLK